MKNILYLFTLVIVFINTSNAQQVIDSTEVSTGWNLIGALSTGVTLEIINTDPPGIITGSFFGYTPGGSYYIADTLNRGKGYWVKVIQNGKIIYLSYTDCGTVNYAGKIYNTVIIGDQCWLKENIDVGTMINGIDTMKNNSVIEKYCHDNDPAYCNTYGGFYQWDEAMQYITTEGSQGICPPGWHIPTLAEFQILKDAVGGDGNALKAIGQGIPGGAGTNTSGFSALLAGFRGDDGSFNNLGYHIYFWSSTGYSSTNFYTLSLNRSNSDIQLNNYVERNGFSIRCLKD